MTVRVMVNRKMATLSKPAHDSTLLKHNRLGQWELQEFTIRQLASFIESGGTWRPGINKVSNKAKDVQALSVIALDFDGAPFKEEPNGGPQGFCRFTELADNVAIAYRTLSWSNDKPYKERLVFALSREVSPTEYERIFRYLLTIYNNADPACGDAIRFFFGSNQPVLVCQDAALDVDKILEASKPVTEAPKKSSKESGGSGKKSQQEQLSISQLVMRDIVEKKLGGDVSGLFCLWPHEFKERTPDAEGAVLKLEGRNPFSNTDSSGTSFVVTQLEGQLPLWHDRSRNARSENGFTAGNGGTIFEYWFKLHQDFRENPGRFSQVSIMSSIYRHFGALMPPEMLIAHYLDILRHRLRFPLRMNALGDIVEYDGEPLPSELLPWFASEAGVYNERNQLLVHQCVRKVARENRYHPFIERIKKFADTYRPSEKLWQDCVHVLFGIPKTSPYFPLYTAYLQHFLLATLARIHYPGIKYDSALGLLGPQGGGKTTTLHYLIPSSYQFPMTEMGQLTRDDVLKARRGVLLLIDDMRSLSDVGKQTAAQIKGMLSSRHYSIREPYAPDAISVPVSWTVCFTANADECTQFLVDLTGNRRFNILPASYCFATDRSIPESVKHEICNTLWATAYAKFQELDHTNMDTMALQLCIPSELWAMSSEHNDKYTAVSTIIDRLEAVLETKLGPSDDRVSLLQIMDWVSPGENLKHNDKHQITQYLRKEGWRVGDEWYTNHATGRKSKRRMWLRPRAGEKPQETGWEIEKADYQSYLAVPEPASVPEPTPVPEPAPTRMEDAAAAEEELSSLARILYDDTEEMPTEEVPTYYENDYSSYEEPCQPRKANNMTAAEAYDELANLSRLLYGSDDSD